MLALILALFVPRDGHRLKAVARHVAEERAGSSEEELLRVVARGVPFGAGEDLHPVAVRDECRYTVRKTAYACDGTAGSKQSLRRRVACPEREGSRASKSEQ